MPSLAIVTQRLTGLSGKVALIAENVPRLVERGWSVDVIAQRVDVTRFERLGARVRRVARPPLGREPRMRWFAWRSRQLAREGYDLVTSHGEGLSDPDVLHLHNCLHRASEAIPGGTLNPVLGGTQRRTLAAREFLRLVANSNLMREELVGRYGIDPERIDVVYPACDLRRFAPDAEDRAARALRSELGVPQREDRDGALVGLITSGDFRKRAVPAFLDALARLPDEQKRRTHVLVVGKEARLGPYREHARRTGMGARIHFLAPRADVEALYRALDVYVHPAHFEEFGMSVLEAMACGIPVLTSAQVGAAELARGAARELLLERIDAELLAERLLRLLADRDLRERVARDGLEASRGQDWNRNVAGHVACYERALAEKRAGSRGAGAVSAPPLESSSNTPP